MITRPSLRTTAQCLDRADRARATAESLLRADDEWFAVTYFYSAYHLVKAAFIEDPVFDAPDDLTGRDQRLGPEDRFVTRHQGSIDDSGRTLGVNDVVQSLYPGIAIEYYRLHMASRYVRYGSGLGVITAASVVDDYGVIRDAWDSGLLRAEETWA